MSFRDLTPHHETLAWQKRFVDFQRKKADHEAALLGAMGMSTNFIQSRTNLSSGQVGYRLKKAGIARADFRNGSSPFARLVLSSARDLVDAKLMQQLEKRGVLYDHAT